MNELLDRATMIIMNSGIKYETKELLADAINFMYTRLKEIQDKDADIDVVEFTNCLPDVE